MIKTNRVKWFDRKFPAGLPVEMLPNMIERLRSGPAAYKDRVVSLSKDLLTHRFGDSWSIQENIGHIVDVEPLWLGRVEDFVNGEERLRPADLANTKTHDARHNETPVENLLFELRKLRMQLISRIEDLSDEELHRSSLHPRLKTPMTVIDLAYFVAEHDVHHLVRINELIESVST